PRGYGAGLASAVPPARPGPLSSSGGRPLARLTHGAAGARRALGRAGALLPQPGGAGGGHATGPLGRPACRRVVTADRPGPGGGGRDLVWAARLDRGRVQRPQARRVALGADQNARSGARGTHV